MYSSLMGSFSCPTPILMIGSSSSEASTSMRSVSFCTSHMEDPWILPTPSTPSEPIVTCVPFPATMIAYQANLECVAEPSPSSSRMEEEDPYVLPAWTVQFLMHTTTLIRFSLQMKQLLRLYRELSHHGRNSIIDYTLFPSLIAWSMRILGWFLV